MEHVTIDVPEEFVGNVTTLLATRKGTMLDIVNHGTGWVRMEWRIPARGLVGIRTEFMTETRGAGIMHSNFDGYAPWFGDIRLRQNGVLVADRSGDTTGNALLDLEQRGVLFVGPGVEVYEGMIVGENARVGRDEREPHQGEEAHQHARLGQRQHRTASRRRPSSRSNRRSSSSPTTRPSRSRPQSVRLRKAVLDVAARHRLRKRAENALR